MNTQSGQRRILRIVDKLENLNDTQIAFEDVRSDKTGLSYFGGAFGGKYEQNSQSWKSSISRFARYQSNPIFKNVVFDQKHNGDNVLLDDTEAQGQITLTTTHEMSEFSSMNGGDFCHPTPDDIYPRGHLSINIGENAGANTENVNMGNLNINIGDSAGKNSKSFDFVPDPYRKCMSINIGNNTGVNSTSHSSVIVGNYAGRNSLLEHTILLGDDAGINQTLTIYGIGIGVNSKCQGTDMISIGRGAGLYQLGVNESVINIGWEAGGSGSNDDVIFLGTRAGMGGQGHSKSVFIGEESGRNTHTVFSVNIGYLAGIDIVSGSDMSTGDVFIGRLSGAGYRPSVPPTADWNTSTINDEYKYNGVNVAIGMQAFQSSYGSFNVSLGYLAGSLLGNINGSSAHHNICIGTMAGHKVIGDENIFIGFDAGSPESMPITGTGQAILIGSYTGKSCDGGVMPPPLQVNGTGLFEIGMHPNFTNDSGSNYRYTNMLFVGNTNEEWVRAGGYFGLAILNTTNVNAMIPHERGFMYYDADINVPKYFNGTSWVVLGGSGGGSSVFTELLDVPSTYTGQADKLVKVNSLATLLEFKSFDEVFNYTNVTPMPEKVGGYEIGTTFNEVSLKDIIDGLLYPYQYPAFTSFAFTGWSNVLEVGASTSINPTATWSTSNETNVAINSIEIRDVTASVNIITGTANDGTGLLTYGAIYKTTATHNVFRITGSNTKSGNFTLDYTVNWYWRIYAGTSSNTSLTESQIEALTNYNALAPGRARTYNLSANNYKYICYPTSMGLTTSFIDAGTGFAIAMQPPITTPITNSNGITTNYYVYRSTNPLVSAVNIIVS